MEQARKQLEDYDAYIASKDGKRLYTLTDKEKKGIINKLRYDIERQTYDPQNRITSFLEFTSQDGKYFIDVELTFKGDFHCERDLSTGHITEVMKVDYVESEDWSCGIWESKDNNVRPNCEKVLDMIEEFFEYREL